MRRLLLVAVRVAAFLMLSTGLALAQNTQAPEGYSITQGAAAPAAPDAPPPANPPMTGPQVLIRTSLGDITLQLDDVRAPRSVAHFVKLVRAGFYDGTAIYRVQKDFVLQMGSWGADGKGRGWNPEPVPLEANNGLKNFKYAVALPRGDSPTGAGPDPGFWHFCHLLTGAAERPLGPRTRRRRSPSTPARSTSARS